MFFANEDYLPDPAMQYKMGYSMSIFIGINILVNYAIIFYHGFKSICLAYTKFYNLYRFTFYGVDPDCPYLEPLDELTDQ